MSLGRQLAEFVANASFDSLPPEAVVQAKRALLDTLGVALAGSREEAARILAERALADGGGGEASVLGWGFRAPAAGAALVNGTAAHALDFDDVSMSMRGHPSAPLLPAVLATAEETRASGAEALLAFVLGFEVAAKMGGLLGARHYDLGWHATSTLGTLGAAAASARLRGLCAERTLAALGIAASMASGLRANFGTMTKPLHAGLAARNGVQAAALAAAGLTAAEDALEAADGFVAAFSGETAPETTLRPLGQPFDIVSPGVAQKLYPCCYATHRAIDAAIELAAGIDPAAIASVRVDAGRGTLLPLIVRAPQTGLEGKFSLEYCVATALLDGAVSVRSFSDAAVARPEVQRLLERIEVVEDVEPRPNFLENWARVRLALADGSVHEKRVDVPRGDPRRPLTWDELTAKFLDCSLPVLGPDQARSVIDTIKGLEELPDVRVLTAALAGKTTSKATS